MVNKRIVEFRESLKISQKEFAESLGYKQNTYNGYETGQRAVKTDLLEKIALMYGVSTDFLLGLTNDPISYYKKEPSVPAKTSTEDYRFQDITKCFYSMNEEGKDSLHKQAIMHYGVKEYKKDDGISSENAG